MSGQDKFVFAPRIGQSGFAMYRVQDPDVKTTYDAVQTIIAEKRAAYEAATSAAAEIVAEIAAKEALIGTKQAEVALLVAGVPPNASSVATQFSELSSLLSAKTELQAEAAIVAADLVASTSAVVAKQAEIAALATAPGNNTAAMAILVGNLAVLTQSQAAAQAELSALNLEISAKDFAVLAKQAQIDLSSTAAGFNPVNIAALIVQTTILVTLNETRDALLEESTRVNALLTTNAGAILSKQVQIGILQSKPGDNGSALSALQAELTSLLNTKTALQTQASQITTDISTNNSAISSKQTEIDALSVVAGPNSAAVALIAVKKNEGAALVADTAALQESKLSFDDVTTQLQATVEATADPPNKVVWSPDLEELLPAVSRLSAVNVDLAQAANADRYSIVDGQLPEGLTFDVDGLLSGTVATAQEAAWTVRAGTEFPLQYADKEFFLHVAPEIVWQTATLNPLEMQQAGQTRQLVSINSTFFSLVAGSLPPGMTLSGLGALSGTPTSSGTSSFTVRATSDHPDIYIDRSFSQLVAATPAWSTPAALTDVARNEAYSFQLVASTLDGPTTFAVQSGSLPPGLSLSSSGLLTGTPSTAGTVTWTVRASGPNAYSDRTFTLIVANRPVWTTAAALANTAQSMTYSMTLASTNGFASGFSVVTGSVPAGTSLSNAGVLSGAPTTLATYTFTVRSLSTTSAIIYADRIFTQTVVPIPVWISAGGAYATVPQGAAISSVQLSATHGIAYSIQSGALPAGLSLSTAGLLTGTPTVAGSFSWTVRVTGSATNATADRSFSISVVVGPGWVTAATLANTARSVPYTFTLQSNDANNFAVVSGALPTGLTLSASGVLSGTPTAAASHTFTVRAFSSPTIYTDRTFSLTTVPLPVWATTTLADIGRDVAYSFQLSAIAA